MELTVEEVGKAINDILGPGGEVDLEIEAGRIVGSVAHPKFHLLDAAERYKLLWDGFRQKFGERANTIGIILMYSDIEHRLMAS